MSSTPHRSGPTPGKIPPLENGDRLSRPEFERRYDAMPNLKKAELVDGIVYLELTVVHTYHGEPHAHAVGWLERYIDATPCVQGGVKSSIRVDMSNMLQPDAVLLIRPELDGRIRIDEDDYLQGTPELVVDVAFTSASYELHANVEVYRRNGTPEYVVWRTRDHAIDWFVLRDGQYQRLKPGPDGILRSEVMPGLWLDPAALIGDDREAMLRVSRAGVESPEHAAFVERLRPEQG